MTAKIISFDNQEDRVLVYIDTYPAKNYYVIAPEGFEPVIGAQITYEPYGFNFGWYKEVVETGW